MGVVHPVVLLLSVELERNNYDPFYYLSNVWFVSMHVRKHLLKRLFMNENVLVKLELLQRNCKRVWPRTFFMYFSYTVLQKYIYIFLRCCVNLVQVQVSSVLFIIYRDVFITLSSICNGAFLQKQLTLHKKWSFRLWLSAVKMTKSAGNCGFGHIYCRNY